MRSLAGPKPGLGPCKPRFGVGISEPGSSGDNATYAKITFHPFVSRLRFRAASPVLRHLRDLADAWPSFAPSGAAGQHPHVPSLEDQRRFDQFLAHDLCPPHGGELYCLNHSWCHDGAQVWKEQAGRILLSRRWGSGSVGPGCDCGLDTMTLPDKSLPKTCRLLVL